MQEIEEHLESIEKTVYEFSGAYHFDNFAQFNTYVSSDRRLIQVIRQIRLGTYDNYRQIAYDMRLDSQGTTGRFILKLDIKRDTRTSKIVKDELMNVATGTEKHLDAEEIKKAVKRFEPSITELVYILKTIIGELTRSDGNPNLETARDDLNAIFEGVQL